MTYTVEKAGLGYADLTQGQQGFVDRLIDWYRAGEPRFAVLQGYAGTGKSSGLKVGFEKLAVPAATDLGAPFLWASAPTHQAVGVLANFLGGVVYDASTLQSLLGLRPAIAHFSHKDAQELKVLSHREILTEDEALRLDCLQRKEQMALEQTMTFEPSKPKSFLSSIRLLIVDECSMVDQQLFTLLHDLVWEGTLVHPGLQVLFVGDPGQLPPIEESMSLTFQRCRTLAMLEEVVRYGGPLLEYATALRNRAPQPETLHRKFECDDLFSIAANEAIFEGANMLADDNGETVRFICGTNARCRELNYGLRVRVQRLKDGVTGSDLYYRPGDELLTTSAVQRGDQSLWVRNPAPFLAKGWLKMAGYSKKSQSFQLGVPYATGRCKKGLSVLNTSTYIRLTEGVAECARIQVVDDYLSKKHGAIVRHDVQLFPAYFRHTTVTGKTFNRQLWRYELSDGGDMDGKEYVWLLDPNQVDEYLAELAALNQLAKTTQSRSKTKRGQEGEYAKQAWDLLGLKNWHEWRDGTAISHDEFKDLQAYLWAEYHALDCFCDPVTWSYAITCHRAQGTTLDVVVIDMPSIIGPAKKQARFAKNGEAQWDVHRLLYVAATRAQKQIVIIE